MRLHAKAARRSSTVVALVALLLVGALASTASAAPKSLLRTIGSDVEGAEGGLFTLPRGVAVNQSTGDLYVADGSNHRIQQFSASGDFIRAWGYDVIDGVKFPGAPNNNGTGFEICDTTAPTPNTAGQCKKGADFGGGPGQIGIPMGIAIDQTNGYLYVTGNANRRVDVFAPNGTFAGAFGWNVAAAGDPGDTAPVNQLEICTTVCQVSAGGGPQPGRISTNLTGSSGLTTSDPSIDPTAPPGTIYVPDSGPNLRVSKFATTISGGKLTSATFLKAFGWDVAPGAVSEEQEVRVKATAGQFTLSFNGDTTADLAFNASAAEVQAALNALPSISSGGGSVTVSGGVGNASGSNLYVVRFDGGPLAGTNVSALLAANGTTPLSGGTPTSSATATTRANGGTTTGLESCTTASGCKAGTSGAGIGQFVSERSPTSSSVDSTGAVYVVSGPLQNPNNNCAPATPCRVYKFDPTTSSATIFGPNVTAGKVGEVAALDVAVDPSNDHVLVNRRTAASKYQVFEYDSSGTLVETHPASPLTSESSTGSHGLEAGTQGRVYTNQTGTSVYILDNVPAPPAPVIAPVTDITPTSAELHGEVTVATEGSEGFDTSWRFEYSSNGIKWTSVPVPDALLGNTPGTYTVERAIGGLEPNTDYFVRLAASTTAATVHSDTLEFNTSTAKPGIDSVFSENLSATEVIIGAYLDANALPTTYHFEWGTQAGVYPNRVPAFERPIGSSSSAVLVKEGIAGLAPETTYHFRVIAENAAGTTVGEDQQLFTLNANGLPADRGIELVSPANKRPVGNVDKIEAAQLHFQAAEDGNAFAFPIFNNLENGTAGGIVIYHASRSQSGWSNAQVTPPSLLVSQLPGDNFSATPGAVRYFSPNLGCALVQTHNPLTPDTPAVDIANGVTNLYRWSAADGSYTLITNRPPLNPAAPVNSVNNFVYQVAGVTSDCSKVYFRSRLYSFIPGATEAYEWDDGVLRDAALRPDGSVPPRDPFPENNDAPAGEMAEQRYTVSDSGERLFFVATSNEAPDSGKFAVFVRKSPTEVVNASKPAPGNLSPTLGAFYEAASPDGSHVFFLANYGLTSAASNGPLDDCSMDIVGARGLNKGAACTLYDYDVETGTLTDLAANTDPTNPKGPMVQGVLDVSEDGSVVYFATRGQLIPDKGQTYLQNTSGSMFANVYRYEEGQLSYVDTVGPGASNLNVNLVHKDEDWSAQTTSDGDYLLFSSADDLDGANPGNVRQAYLYSHETGTTVCVSCPKGHDPVKPGEIVAQVTTTQANGGGPYTPRSLSEDGRVFFMSRDPLVAGAIEGDGETSYNRSNERTNVYEWHRGQLSLLSTERTRFIDMSADGATAFARSFEQLVPEDIDFAPDVYAFRVGSPGFAPPVPEIPCDPGADQCQGAPTPGPAAPNPASAGFSGPGNPPPPAAKKAKKKKAKKNRKKRRRAKQRAQRAKAKSNRAAKTNRGGAK